MPGQGRERVDAWLHLSDATVRLSAFDLLEKLSSHAEGSARLAPGERLPADLSPPAAAWIVLERGDRQRRFAVVIRSVSRGATTTLKLAGPTLPLTLARRPRRFRDRTAREIVEAVVASHGLEIGWQMEAELSRHPYVVQHDETDLAFVTRVLADEGAYFFFEEGRLVVSDASHASAFVDHPLEVLRPDGEQHGREGIVDMLRGKRVAAGRVTAADYDWKRPLLPLKEASVAPADGDLEHYVWPAGFRDPEAGRRIAALRLQALRSGSDYAEGSSNVLELATGKSFELAADGPASHVGQWFVTELKHDFREQDASERGGYFNRFLATARPLPYRPKPARPPPLVGYESVVARGPEGVDIHTDAFGRFKAEMPWDEESTRTDEGARWTRLLQECSTSMFLARTGWEMLATGIDGDPARPIGVGRGIHATMPPSYTQPAFQTATTVRTRSSPAGGGGASELAIDDGAAAQRIDLVAQRDIATRVKHDQAVRIGGDAEEVVGASRQLVVRGDRSVTVGADTTTTVQGDTRVAIAGSAKGAVAGSESIETRGDRKESVGKTDVERVGSLRLTIAGGIASPAEIARSLIPSPRRAVAGALAAAKARALEPLTSVQGAATAPLAAARGIPSGAAAVVPQGGVAGVIDAAGAASALPAAVTSLGDAVGGLKQLPSAIGALPGAVGSSLPGAVTAARESLAGALEASIPNLRSIADALPLGSITRKSSTTFSRRVGGAFLSVTLGDITTSALLAYAELVGAVRIKLTPANISTSVGGPLVSVVGGSVRRSSAGSIDLVSRSASFRAGGPFSLDAKGGLTINGDHVMLRSKSGITIGSADAKMEITPSKLAIQAKLITDVPRIEAAGPAMDVTKG